MADDDDHEPRVRDDPPDVRLFPRIAREDRERERGHEDDHERAEGRVREEARLRVLAVRAAEERARDRRGRDHEEEDDGEAEVHHEPVEERDRGGRRAAGPDARARDEEGEDERRRERAERGEAEEARRAELGEGFLPGGELLGHLSSQGGSWSRRERNFGPPIIPIAPPRAKAGGAKSRPCKPGAGRISCGVRGGRGEKVR